MLRCGQDGRYLPEEPGWCYSQYLTHAEVRLGRAGVRTMHCTCAARCTMHMRCTMRCPVQQVRLRKRGLGSEAASASACGFVPGEGLRCAGAKQEGAKKARQWEGNCVTAAAWLESAPQLLKWTTMTASTTKVSLMRERLQPCNPTHARLRPNVYTQGCRVGPVCTTKVPRGGWDGALKEMFAVARQRGGAMGGGAAGCALSSGCVNHTHAVCGGSRAPGTGHRALRDSTRGKGRQAIDGRSKEGRSNGRSNARGRGAMAAGRSNGGRARGRAAGGAGAGAARGRGRGRGAVSSRAKARGSAVSVTETSTAGVYVTDAGVYVTRTS